VLQVCVSALTGVCLFILVACLFLNRVLECQGLPIVNGQCDPYAAVSLLGPSRSDRSHDWTRFHQTLLSFLMLAFEKHVVFISFCLSASLRSEAKKTKVKRKTNNPQFEEVFYFEVNISACWLLNCYLFLIEQIFLHVGYQST